MNPKNPKRNQKLSTNPKISKNLKIIFFDSKHLKFLKNMFLSKNKPNKNSFFLNIRNTRFDKSSPVHPNPEKNIMRIAKRCPENISLIVKVSTFFTKRPCYIFFSFYYKLIFVIFQVLSPFEFF